MKLVSIDRSLLKRDRCLGSADFAIPSLVRDYKSCIATSYGPGINDIIAISDINNRGAISKLTRNHTDTATYRDRDIDMEVVQGSVQRTILAEKQISVWVTKRCTYSNWILSSHTLNLV